MAFDRKRILEREAERAVLRIEHARQIWLEEKQHKRPSGMAWATSLYNAAQRRWARAAALIARLELTLDERRATR